MFVRNRREGVSGHLSEKMALERLAKRIRKESNSDNEDNFGCNECTLQFATNGKHGDEYVSDDERHCTVALTFTIQPHSRSDYYLPKLMSNNKLYHTLTFHSNEENTHLWKSHNNKINDSCKAADDKNNLTVTLETSRMNQQSEKNDALYCEQMNASFSFQFELLRHYLFRHFVNCRLLPTLSSAKERHMQYEEKQFITYKNANIEMVPKFTRSELEELPARWVLQSINEMERVESTRRFVTPLDINELVYVRHAECHNTQTAQGTDCIDSCSYLNSKHSVDHNKQNVTIPPSAKTTLKQPDTILCNQNVAGVDVVVDNSSSNSYSSNIANDEITSNPVYRVTDTAFMSNGEYWVEVEQLDQTNNISNNHYHYTNTIITDLQEREKNNNSQNNNNNKYKMEEGNTVESDGSCQRAITRLRVQREMVELCEPKYLYIDPFVPCDEAFAIQGTSTCIYVSLLKALLRNEDANLQNTQQEQESISSYKVMERIGTCCGTKHCETNVHDNKKSNFTESQGAIESNQEKVEKHIPRKCVSYTEVLTAAKQKAASMAVCVALQTHTLRKTLATEYAELQKSMELSTDTNTRCKDDLPLVSVRWNAKNATVYFKLAVSEYVCHRLQELECMELMQNDFIMEEESQEMNEEKEKESCHEEREQQIEKQTNSCKTRKFYEFTLRESVVMRLSYAFDLYMSDRNKIESKNIEEGAPTATSTVVAAANHVLTNPTDTSKSANTEKLQGDDNNKCNSRNERREFHGNTLNVNENNDDNEEEIEYNCWKNKTIKYPNALNVHDFCTLLHATSLEENITVNSAYINRIGIKKGKYSKNNCNDVDSHQKNITHEEYIYEIVQSTENETCNSSHAMFDLFALRVSTMCLRYRTLFGERGYNQGPHAALPEYVMNCLRREFNITTEGFASPLNASLECYTSLFPDTDVYFGSCGGFCDVIFTSGHVEVNPPFDTAIMRKMEKHILHCLRQSEQMPCSIEHPPSHTTSGDSSLLFVIVLPSHTNLPEKEIYNRKRGRNDLHGKESITDNNSNDSTCHRSNKKYSSNYEYINSSNNNSNSEKTSREQSCRSKSSTEYNLINSPFCLGHVLCSAEDSCYVDGHQHVLHEALFCITTPTRLIVLGNKTAQKLYNSTQYFNNNCDDMLQNTHNNTSNNHNSHINVIHKGNEIERRLTKIQKAWTEFTAAAKLSPNTKSE